MSAQRDFRLGNSPSNSELTLKLILIFSLYGCKTGFYGKQAPKTRKSCPNEVDKALKE
jgi:hypothetical protein